MKVAFVINEQLTTQQVEHSYLLCLAMLNFDHVVHVIFINEAFESLIKNSELQKQWLALKTYGAEKFYQLKTVTNPKEPAVADKHCQLIDMSCFESLKSKMDLLL